MYRRLPEVDRFAFQVMRPDLVRDHDRPPSRSAVCWRDPGSTVSSGRSVLPASPSTVRTRQVYRPSWRSLRIDRFVVARCGVPTSVCSGLASASPPSPVVGEVIRPKQPRPTRQSLCSVRPAKAPPLPQVRAGACFHTSPGAGQPIKHPGRYLQPPVRTTGLQIAAENNATRSFDCLVDTYPKPKPGMPRIQQLTKNSIP